MSIIIVYVICNDADISMRCVSVWKSSVSSFEMDEQTDETNVYLYTKHAHSKITTIKLWHISLRWMCHFIVIFCRDGDDDADDERSFRCRTLNPIWFLIMKFKYKITNMWTIPLSVWQMGIGLHSLSSRSSGNQNSDTQKHTIQPTI